MMPDTASAQLTLRCEAGDDGKADLVLSIREPF